jgi:ribonuclease BN (tRNA processing enzyme)
MILAFYMKLLSLLSRFLNRTSRIFITHMNGDHLIGLPSVIMNNQIKKNYEEYDDEE